MDRNAKRITNQRKRFIISLPLYKYATYKSKIKKQNSRNDRIAKINSQEEAAKQYLHKQIYTKQLYLYKKKPQ